MSSQTLLFDDLSSIPERIPQCEFPLAETQRSSQFSPKHAVIAVHDRGACSCCTRPFARQDGRAVPGKQPSATHQRPRPPWWESVSAARVQRRLSGLSSKSNLCIRFLMRRSTKRPRADSPCKGIHSGSKVWAALVGSDVEGRKVSKAA
jgi:hypothetical protein